MGQNIECCRDSRSENDISKKKREMIQKVENIEVLHRNIENGAL